MKKYFYLLLAAVALLTLSCEPNNPVELDDMPLLSTIAKSVMGKTPEEVEKLMKTYDFTKQTTRDQQVEYRDADKRPVTIVFNDNNHAVTLRSTGLDRSVYTIDEWEKAGPYLMACHADLTNDYKWGQVQGFLTSEGWNAEAYNEADVAFAILHAAAYDSIPVGEVHFSLDYFTSLVAQGGPEAHVEVNFKDGRDVQIFFTYNDEEIPDHILLNVGELTAQVLEKTIDESIQLLEAYGLQVVERSTNVMDMETVLVSNNNGFEMSVGVNEEFGLIGNYEHPINFDSYEDLADYLVRGGVAMQGFTSWSTVAVKHYEGVIDPIHEFTPDYTATEYNLEDAILAMCTPEKLTAGQSMRIEFNGSNDPVYAWITSYFDVKVVDAQHLTLETVTSYAHSRFGNNYPNIGELTVLAWSAYGSPERAAELLKQKELTVADLDYSHYLMTDNNGFYLDMFLDVANYGVSNYSYPLAFSNDWQATNYLLACLPAIQGLTSWKTATIEVYNGDVEDRAGKTAIYSTQVTNLEKDIRDVVKNHMGADTFMLLTFNGSSEKYSDGQEKYFWISSFVYLSELSNNQYQLRVLTVGDKTLY